MNKGAENAPKGKFRVVGAVSNSDGTWVVGDFDSLDQAVRVTRDLPGGAYPGIYFDYYIYNDQGIKIEPPVAPSPRRATRLPA